MTPPRTAVVTGGARGIGAATAAALAAAGYQVVVGDIEPTGAALPLDVSDRAAFTAFLDAAEERLGPLGVLVNNAGIMPLSRVADEPDETTARILAVNLHAVIHGSREAVRRMLPRGGGHIVNVASVAARAPNPGAATYAASKAGMLAFSAALRTELRGTGVEVSCVLPGLVATDLSAGIAVRGYRPIDPRRVGRAVLGVLRRPRPEVYVPAQVGVLLRVGSLAGRRFGDWLQRVSGADDVVLGAIGSDGRREYERRAAR
ncbi:SDR family NAD(P)-dependent oxidoreductase [Paractinoplanes rishiriensis]|uniref:Short-chain dehydrogenase n=1 Tax=Paractinoplanes rishiriensis TaxID=1050105 RepID=A0A919JUU5_9ACTN|nr:SDR family NAD(P)-dependent oxidoreductase [Actinoplanes rishiriensis]GIE95626.1 short-chain dehydrogenase [Actinoplanes rishiriensis]